MSEWITDRAPTEADGNPYVWVTSVHGSVLRQKWDMVYGRPWQPIVKPKPYVKPKRMDVREPKPYVKPKRWEVRELQGYDQWYLIERVSGDVRSYAIPTREAAERIAAIYEEVMP